jgi:hypothetical protein
MIINIPEMTPMEDYAKVQFATEVAFGQLLAEAKKLGLPLNPVMGLMYMPTQDVTRQWQEACRAVLDALDPTPKEPDAPQA